MVPISNSQALVAAENTNTLGINRRVCISNHSDSQHHSPSQYAADILSHAFYIAVATKVQHVQ